MDLLFIFNECGTARQFLVPLGTSAHPLQLFKDPRKSLYVLMPQAWFFHLCVYSVAYVRPLPWCVACYPRSQSHYHLGLRFEEETETVTEWHVASVSVIALIRTFQMANSSPRHWKLSKQCCEVRSGSSSLGPTWRGDVRAWFGLEIADWCCRSPPSHSSLHRFLQLTKTRVPRLVV